MKFLKGFGKDKDEYGFLRRRTPDLLVEAVRNPFKPTIWTSFDKETGELIAVGTIPIVDVAKVLRNRGNVPDEYLIAVTYPNEDMADHYPTQLGIILDTFGIR